jgi:hypothetical protein
MAGQREMVKGIAGSKKQHTTSSLSRDMVAASTKHEHSEDEP